MLARRVLDDDDLFALTRLLTARYTKVTFVGGEPTLYPRLPELLATAKEAGELTNVHQRFPHRPGLDPGPGRNAGLPHPQHR